MNSKTTRAGNPVGRRSKTDASAARFAAFGNRNFRLYYVGQTISSIGSWIQALAVSWLVLEITNRSDRLGISMALQFLPLLLLGASAGVLADKFDNRRLLVATSMLSGLLASTFAAVVGTGHVTIWWIYVLSFLLGLVLAVERPTRQAILFQLVGPDLLSSAIAANGTINSVSRIIGPAVAGALISVVGIEACFYVNAASYLVVIVALVALRSSELIDRPRIGRMKGRLREGFAYVRTRPDVARPLLVMTVVGTVALNFPTTFPSMIRFGFHRGAGSVGIAMGVSAIGSIIAGIYVAGINPDPRRTLAITLAGFAAACLALSIAPDYWPFVIMSVVLGFASASFQSVNAIVLQESSDPSMQGRVMALHQMALFGSTPIGALLMGWVIHVSSPRVPFVLGGLSALVCAGAVIVRPSFRSATA